MSPRTSALAAAALAAAARSAGLAALLVGTPLLVVAIHLRQRGEAAIAESDRALATGETASAIAWARDAAMAVCPGSPYPEEGYARLRSLAARAEAHGDFVEATAAWRAVRTAVHATRTEDREAARLVESGRALVRLAARTCEGNQSRPPTTCAAAAEAALAVAPLPPLASFGWLGLGGLSFLVSGAVASRTSGRTRNLSAAIAVLGLGIAALALLAR